MDCWIFNVRTWSILCVRMHTGVGSTDSESAQHFWLGKIHSCFLRPWRHPPWQRQTRVTDVINIIFNPTLYQLSHPVIPNDYCASADNMHIVSSCLKIKPVRILTLRVFWFLKDLSSDSLSDWNRVVLRECLFVCLFVYVGFIIYSLCDDCNGWRGYSISLQ